MRWAPESDNRRQWGVTQIRAVDGGLTVCEEMVGDPGTTFEQTTDVFQSVSQLLYAQSYDACY